MRLTKALGLAASLEQVLEEANGQTGMLMRYLYGNARIGDRRAAHGRIT